MATKKDKIRRMGIRFADELDLLKIERIKLGVDKRMISDARLTDGILAEPEWISLKEKLKRKKRKEDLL